MSISKFSGPTFVARFNGVSVEPVTFESSFQLAGRFAAQFHAHAQLFSASEQRYLPNRLTSHVRRARRVWMMLAIVYCVLRL